MSPKIGNLGKISDLVRFRNAVSVSKNLSTSPHLSEHTGGLQLPEEIKGWPRVCADMTKLLGTEDKSRILGTDDRICSNHFHLPWWKSKGNTSVSTIQLEENWLVREKKPAK